MILNSSILRYSLFLGISVVSLTALGQVQDTVTKPPTIEEIEVIRDYKPILADAVKIRRSPDLSNIRVYQPELKYSGLNQRIDIPSGLYQLRIHEMPPVRPENMTNNYAKIGLGNLNTYLGELYINSGEDETMQVGGFAKLYNRKGDLKGQKFSNQQVGIFGRKVLDQVSLNGEIGYNRLGTAFYGFNPARPDANLDPSNQAYNDLYFNAELLKNYIPMDDDISYSAKVAGYLFSDKYDASEKSIALSGYFNKKMESFSVGLNASVDFTSVHDTKYKMGNSIARINPYVRIFGDSYRLTLGGTLAMEFGDFSSTNLFPAAELEYDMVPKYVTLFGGVKGDVVKTSIRELAKINPYLNENLNIINQTEKIHGFAGVKGNAGATVGYKASVSYKKIENFPLLVNSETNATRFDLIYDSEKDDTSVLGLEGELNIRVSETVNLGGRANYNKYSMGLEERAWFLPKFQMTSYGRINVSDKLFIDGEVLFNSATSAKVYKEVDASLPLPDPTEPGTSVKNYSIKSMRSFVDLGGAIEYRIDKTFGIYVRANNILGKKYERFLYYPNLGLNVIGGINYSF